MASFVVSTPWNRRRYPAAVSIAVHKIEFGRGPADASEFERRLAAGEIDPDTVVAVIGKTEGNGGVHDFTRILADRAYRDALLRHGSRHEAGVRAIPMVWSGGTDGVLCPHASVFCRVDGAPAGLAVGVALSEEILPEDIGRMAMVDKVATGVRAAGEGRTATGSRPRRLCSPWTASVRPEGGAGRPRSPTPTDRWTSPTARRRWGSVSGWARSPGTDWVTR